MEVAYKHLSRDDSKFEEFTPQQQNLWNLFETDQTYRFLIGERDTVLEFRFNYYPQNFNEENVAVNLGNNQANPTDNHPP